MTGAQLDRAAFAARLGVDPQSVTRGVRQRRYPQPDGHLGGRPWWWESTVAAFAPAKAGRPLGGKPLPSEIPAPCGRTDPHESHYYWTDKARHVCSGKPR